MAEALRVTEVCLAPAREEDRRAGLLGYVSATVNGLRVDGLALRLTLDGRHVLSWPARRDRRGRQHAYVLPLCDRERRRIEREILRSLGLRQEATRAGVASTPRGAQQPPVPPLVGRAPTPGPTRVDT